MKQASKPKANSKKKRGEGEMGTTSIGNNQKKYTHSESLTYDYNS